MFSALLRTPRPGPALQSRFFWLSSLTWHDIMTLENGAYPTLYRYTLAIWHHEQIEEGGDMNDGR